MHGMTIKNSSGAIFMTPDLLPLSLHSRLTKNLSNYRGEFYVDIDLPYNSTTVVFSRCSRRKFYFHYSLENNNGYLRLVCYSGGLGDCKIDFYIFTTDSRHIKDNYGIAFYDASGNLTYHSSMIPLSIENEKYHTVPNGKMEFDYNVAAISLFYGWVSSPYGQGYMRSMKGLTASGKYIESTTNDIGVGTDVWMTGPYTNTCIINADFYDNALGS